MTDPDETLRKRYREIEAPEPPAALDQAILASARRAVAPRASQRWAMPVSLAAVLVLAVGVTLRMQQEKPGIESSVPNEYSVPSSPPAEPVAVPAPPPVADATPRATEAAPARAAVAKPDVQQRARPQPEKKEKVEAFEEARPAPQPKAFADAAPPAASMPMPQRMERSTATDTVASAAAPAAPPAAKLAAEATAGARRDAAAESDLARGKRAAAQSSPQIASAPPLAKEAADPREKELQRIAQLRREGRHAEADEALRLFRRDHPDYRIPEAVWDQVKPR